MNYQTQCLKIFFLFVSGVVLFTRGAYAQEPKPGKLKIHVPIPEAYTFVDGKAIGPGNRSIRLGEGNHRVSVANYGFKIFQQDISIEAGKNTNVEAKLEPAGGPGSRPWGRMQTEIGTSTRDGLAIHFN